jgi:hypothetical protein
MSDAVPDTLSAPPAPPDRRIILTAALSVALHLMLFGLVLLPRLHLPKPTEPPAVNVDLVPPPEVSSEAPASSAEPVSSEAPSSAEPSSQEAASSAAASEEPASTAPSSAPEPAAQEVARARPIVIPVGPSEASSEAASSEEEPSASEEPSSAASEPASAEASSAAEETAPSELTAATEGETGAAEPAAAEAPPIKGALHVAKRFYLAAMLEAPAMARAREAIAKLPRAKRLVQTCNLEAVGQLGNAGRDFNPDAVIADALAKPVANGSTFTVTGGAFRSEGTWRALSYTCTLSKDLSAVKSFSYRVGDDVTALLKSRLGG